MKQDYWEKNKRGLLPKIKDWSDPHNEIRHSNNVKAMTYNEWLYLHPSAYKLIWYGTDWVGIVIFGLVAWFLAHKGSFFGASIPLVFVIALIYDLIRKMQLEKNKTIITITHDINLAARYCEKVLLLGSDTGYLYGGTKDVFRPEQIENFFGVRTLVGTVGNEKFFIPVGKFAKNSTQSKHF